MKKIERETRIAPFAIFVFLLFALSVAQAQVASEEFVFLDSFESSHRTVLSQGVVELRSASGQVKATRETTQAGFFQRFPRDLIQPGDELVAFGGFWQGDSFAGEFRLLLTSPVEPQIVTPITTLLTAVAKADFTIGSSPGTRRLNAVAAMTGLGMIIDDWNTLNPSRIGDGLKSAVENAGGILAWTNLLLGEIEAGEISNEQMATFPYTNASVLGVTLPADATVWITGDRGPIDLQLSTSRDSILGWRWSMSLEQNMEFPPWAILSSDGILDFIAPSEPESGVMELTVTDLETSLTRVVSIPYNVQTGIVAASSMIGPSGGQVWLPDGSFGVGVPTNALSETIEFQLINYTDSNGAPATRFRTIPADAEIALPLEMLFGGNTNVQTVMSDLPAQKVQATENVCAETVGLLDPGWTQRMCTQAGFVRVRRAFSLDVIAKLNRVPAGITQHNVDQSVLFGFDYKQQAASLLASGCTICGGKTPVLFIHGFTAGGGFGGGKGTWGDLPELLHRYRGGPTAFAVYEFRYRSNASFADVAEDLGKAIEFIFNETGRKVNIVAHSFGGLVARTYLQGLASGTSPVPEPFSDCDQSRHPYAASLLTIGTPHSGVSGSVSNRHGTWLPDGQHNLIGQFGIPLCNQLSCWEAGATALPFGVAGASAADWALLYGVADTPGELISEINDYSANPLSVPVRVLMSLARSDSVNNEREVVSSFQQGDGLVSYQGQRFSPEFSCAASDCANEPLFPMQFSEINGQPVGHCIEEVMLGTSFGIEDIPFPSNPLLNSGSLVRDYKHSGAIFNILNAGAIQPTIEENEHLPLLRDDATGAWGAKHDVMNQILHWLAPGETTSVIEIEVLGQGQVQLESTDPAGTIACRGTCRVPVASGEVSMTLVPDPGAVVSDLPQGCTMASGDECLFFVAGWDSARFAFEGGSSAQIQVIIEGSGTVAVSPIGQECADPVCTYTVNPDTMLTLSVASGSFQEWSGQCATVGNDCQVQTGGVGSERFVTANFLPPATAGETFTDCANCPTMVQIPAGTFTQGSPASELGRSGSEGPQRTVNVPAFAIGQTEVTFDQWDACVADGGCSHNPDDEGWGRGDRPVIHVSWNDAQEYVTWMSNRTGHEYRLPSESEWEYATRAGTTGRFNTGDCITTDQANFYGDFPAQNCPVGINRSQTVVAGSFSSNAFGLFDTHGNVAEKVADCWNDSYVDAPIDGSAVLSGDCTVSVVRGGSWITNLIAAAGGAWVRSAARNTNPRISRYSWEGFRVARSLRPNTTFTDCANCPTMVQIPAGSFVQGSPPDEPERNSNEGPQRTVNVPAFAMGQTEVTFSQWDACVTDGGCSRTPSDFGWGRGDRPVIDVNWNDAQEYVAWLSNRTGQDYRLPSESEWEYATRAGTTGRFNTGDCITTDQANFGGTSPAQGCPTGIDRNQTVQVASFAPNAFGLYDTHGNVWEWVEDCWNASYTSAPINGSAWMTGDCSRAVLRGGSWFIDGLGVRSALRHTFTRGDRSFGAILGFRVARSVTL